MTKLFFNKPLRILLITNSLILISMAMLGPIYALFVEKIGGNLLDASLTGGIFALAAGITTLLAGKYADKLKRQRAMLANGYLIMGIGFLLYMFVNSIQTLFAVQILVGFAEAFYSPAFDSLYTKHTTKTKVGREWGAWESVNYFSLAIGAAAGGFIAFRFGFNPLFITMACLCFLSAIYLYVKGKGEL